MSQDKYKVKCIDCGSEFELAESSYNYIKRKNPDKPQFRCKECMKKHRSEMMKKFNAERTPEQKAKQKEAASNFAKNRWKNMTAEEKEKYMKIINDKSKEWRENETDEERERISKIHTESNINRWNKKTDEEKKLESICAKERWKNLSDEEKEKWSQKSKDNWNNKSKDEIDEIKKKISTSKKNWWDSLDEKDLSEICNKISNSLKEYWDSLTEEEIKNISNKRKEYWNSLSEEERKIKSMESSERLKDFWKLASEEYKNNVVDKLLNGWNNWYNSLSDEDKENIRKENSNKSKEYWNNITDEEKINISKNRTEEWNRLSDEDKQMKLNLLHNGFKEWWNNLSNNEKSKWINSLTKSANDKWNSSTEEEKNLRNKHLSNKSKEWWNSMSDIERSNFTRNALKSVSNNNNKLFENKFHESIMSEKYHFISEYPTVNKTSHCWDYGIFDEHDNLIMIIDLDGSYFHADKCDYDGLHSKEEYDEKRGLSIPDGVKWCIINEKNFEECFSYLEKIIPLSYDEFLKLRFKEYRNIPFPQPHYTDGELIRSFESLKRMDCNDKYHQDLSLNTRLGDRIIQHFHTSLYDEAQSAWKNDDILYDLTIEHAMYQSYLNKNKILQGLNVSEICPIQRILSPAKVKMIINKYLNEYNEIFNPYNVYSEIMLACIASGKRYIGKDCNIERLNESNKIAEFLQKYGIQMDVSLYSDIDNREFECMLTEIYNENDIEDIVLKYKCKHYIFILNDNIIEIEGK